MSVDEMTVAANTQLYYMPYLYLPDTILTRDEYNKAISEAAEAGGHVLIGGEDDIPGNKANFVDSVHFTPSGSRRMAERVTTKLLADSQVRRYLRERGCNFDSDNENL